MTTNAAGLGLALAIAGLLTCTARAQVAYVVSQPVATYGSVGAYYLYPTTVQTYAAPVAVAGYAPVSSGYSATYSVAPVSYGAVSYPQTYALPGWYVVPQTATSVMPAGHAGFVYSGTW